jgi:hypothetical protein
MKHESSYGSDGLPTTLYDAAREMIKKFTFFWVAHRSVAHPKSYRDFDFLQLVLVLLDLQYFVFSSHPL